MQTVTWLPARRAATAHHLSDCGPSEAAEPRRFPPGGLGNGIGRQCLAKGDRHA